MRQLSHRVFVALLAAVVLIVAPSAATARHDGSRTPVKTPTATGAGGAAATVDPVATQAALQTLRAGGNAVDAAITAAGVLGVVEPYSCGVGGGGFMTVYTARDGQVHTIDSRETAPAAMNADSFKGLTDFRNQQRVSGMSVGVPGTVRAWQKALDEYGTWPLRRVLQAGIRTAQRGFVVDQTFFDQTAEAQDIFADFPATAALYLDADGTPRDVGSVIRNPDLAKTYRLLAHDGPDAFYHGPLAQAIVDTVQHPPVTTAHPPTHDPRPGVMTLDDLAKYQAIDRDPTHVGYRGLDVYGMAPPSSGGSTVGEILNILEGYDMGSLPREQALHYFIEASRYAFADRNEYIGDPAFVDVPLAGLLSDSFAAERRANITGTAATSPVAYGDPTDNSGPAVKADNTVSARRVGSTTNMTVSDRWGNVVEYTFTIEQTGGSGMVVPGYGFLLNNELTDFTLDPDGSSPPVANQVAGGKRPRSSIAPTIVLRDGKPFFAVGSPGGASIITTDAQIIVNRVDFGMSLPEAIAAPRLSQRNSAKTQTEQQFLGTPEAAALEARGQRFTVGTGTGAQIGAATGIEALGGGRLLAAAEPVRRGGGSAGVVFDHPGRGHGFGDRRGDGHRHGHGPTRRVRARR